MKSLKNINWLEVYIYLLLSSAFISISVFEIFVAIGLLIVIYQAFRKNISKGILTYPLLVFVSTAFISTLIFNISQISKAIEQAFFQLIYFLNPKNINIKRFLIWINGLFIFWAIIQIPIILYKSDLDFSKVSAIWGGVFEVANFYTIFSFVAFFIFIYFLRRKKYFLALLFLILFFVFIGMLIFTHKRAYILSFFVLFYLILFILYRSLLIKRSLFIGISLAVLLSVIGGYIYLSKTDIRFKELNNIITGKKELNFQTLQSISSKRYGIMHDALNIVENDIKRKNYINLLIGHGINSGYYLPHKYTPNYFGKYESIFIVSEFIEIGLIGLLAELMIFFLVFRFLVGLRLYFEEDLLALSLVLPLAIHLLSVIFTFFWDALLPLYFLLFKIGEFYFKDKNRFMRL